jgi:tRNA pseudouridine55 synthase
MELQGAFIIDKPAGITSHDVVARMRRIINTRRVGHAGTLDPFATGVLVVCVGHATRLTQFLVGLDKVYTATIRFGYATDTHDATGKPVKPLATSNKLTDQDIAAALRGFTGPQLQMPPMYSAKKIAGERLYRAAREGREVERPALPVTVYSLALVGAETGMERAGMQDNTDGTKDVTVRLRCSSGTYVRRLAHDIGERLEVGAHLVALRRESVGLHNIDQAVTLEALEHLADPNQLSSFMLSPAEAINHMQLLALTDDEVARIMNGREIELNQERCQPLQTPGMIGLCDRYGDLRAVGELMAGRLEVKPRMVLPAQAKSREERVPTA